MMGFVAEFSLVAVCLVVIFSSHLRKPREVTHLLIFALAYAWLAAWLCKWLPGTLAINVDAWISPFSLKGTSSLAMFVFVFVKAGRSLGVFSVESSGMKDKSGASKPTDAKSEGKAGSEQKPGGNKNRTHQSHGPSKTLQSGQRIRRRRVEPGWSVLPWKW